MYIPLGQKTLKSGERLEIGVVCAPDRDWGGRIRDFLGHKGDDWLPQIIAALDGTLDSLTTRFYVGQIDGRMACQTMVTGDRGVGILGHVFTRPEDRRKGAIQTLLEALMQDCCPTYRILTLGTGFESPAYWIYHRLGFRSIGPGRGEMLWSDTEIKPDTMFDPAPSHVRPVRWDDWAFFNLLAAQPVAGDEDLPRGPMLGLKAQGSIEGEFLKFQARRTADTRVQAAALVSETGATVGWALCGPDPGWFDDVWLLDLHTQSNFSGQMSDLLTALEWPDAPVVSYLTNSNGAKAAALRGTGFRQEARFLSWLNLDGKRDMLMMRRGAEDSGGDP